ncbi:MAG: T9SS type A sorting domain-containing protein [Bacteroidales bacterium]|jgi:hypothetical protein|nr:T9SS type A sorting domain-containing protein [Bacteroidales bacterium]
MKRIIFILAFLEITIYSYSQTISEQSNNVAVCIGETISLKMEISGYDGFITYSVDFNYLNQGSMVEIPTSNNTATVNASGTLIEYNISNASLSDIGRYQFRITSPVNIVSNELSVIVSSAVPNITSLASNNQYLCEGGSTTLTALYTPEESGISFSWYKNSQSYPSYSGNTIVFNNPTSSDAGTYHVIASNACGTSTPSNNVTLIHLFLPNLSNFPIIPSVCEGEDANITVTPYAGTNLSFQWYQKIGEDTTVLSSETTNELHLTNIPYLNPATYFLVATNVCGVDTLHNFGVQTNNLPTAISSTDTLLGCPTSTFDLYGSATSTTSLTYQWFGGTNPTPIDSTSHLTIDSNNGYEPYYYYVVTNSCGSDTSNYHYLNFKTPPAFDGSLQGATLCVGDSLTLNTKVVGDEPMTIEWFRLINDTAVLVQFLNASFTNDNQTLIINNIAEWQAGEYFCMAINECGMATTDTVSVVVNTPVSLALNIQNITICEGEEFGFSLNQFMQVSGTEPISYIWYKEDTQDIEIETGNEYSVSSATSQDAGIYYCELSNMCNTIETFHASVTVKSLPHIQTQPLPIETCVGGDFQLSVVATGEPTLIYAWYRNSDFIDAVQTISYSNVQINKAGYYYCSIHNECGDIDSDSVLVSIGTPAYLTNGPNGNNSLCEFDTIQLTVFVSGTNYHVNWYHNNVQISGIDATTLILPNIHVSDAGNYHCRVWNGCSDTTSADFYVTINPAPAMDLGPDLAFCQGVSHVLETSGSFASYTWNTGTLLIHTQTLTVTQSGTYILQVVANDTYCKNSDTVVVTFHPFFNSSLPTTITECANSIILNPGNGGYNYIWNTEATTQTISVTAPGTYTVTVSGDEFGCSVSFSTLVSIYPPINISLGEDKSISVNSGVTIGVEPIYDSYLWNTNATSPTIYVLGEDYGEGTQIFWITVFGQYGCSATDTIQVTFTPDFSIIPIDYNNLLSVYPNPANDVVNFVLKDEIISNIIIYSIDGKELINKNINKDNCKIDINNFAVGTYFAKIMLDDNKIIVRKFVKN